MEKGRRLYTDKVTGNLVFDTGECSDVVNIPSVEDDFLVYKYLRGFNLEALDIIELEYEAYEQDFREGRLKGIDPVTKELLFSYPDPQAPGEVTPPQLALSMQVAELKLQNTELMLAVAELASANETDKIETQLAIAELATIVMGGVV